MKKVLFVCYGSGHVRMVVPVAKALAEAGLARVVVLALTTAAPVARAAGLEVVQFKHFLQPGDEAALAHGRRLMAEMPHVADPEETAAYLGLSYAELEADVGPEEAGHRYARDGRQAFLPRRALQRILRQVAPDLVFATNSPRAERAAVEAARALGLPSICLVDLFCLDEIKWIGSPLYADRVCVLNDAVKRFLLESGRGEAQVSVTGNPAFDAVFDPASAEAGLQLRRDRHWEGRKVVLWPTQVEPAFHPFNGAPGDSSLPRRTLEAVTAWALAHEDCVLCVRPRAGEGLPDLPDHPRIVLAGQGISLPALLHAVDLVVTLNSTVGLEGHLAGARLVQVLGSVFDSAMPLATYGIADEAVSLGGLAAALDRWAAQPRKTTTQAGGAATGRVVDVIREFL
ncbi:MAG: UDP-glycosyltransferase [Comamonadaceae bacterium]|nr:MAG: UDP-glycosyltransferase [Comamonadaceae bacterium]